jgi:ABC-type nitrate/sulfonate/bicarbonate transport system permease component
MIKLQDMPPLQRTVMALVFVSIIVIGVIGFLQPRGSSDKWNMFLLFGPGLLVGYALGVWVGSSKKR